jgi:hypothetical protein
VTTFTKAPDDHCLQCRLFTSEHDAGARVAYAKSRLWLNGMYTFLGAAIVVAIDESSSKSLRHMTAEASYQHRDLNGMIDGPLLVKSAQVSSQYAVEMMAVLARECATVQKQLAIATNNSYHWRSPDLYLSCCPNGLR